jgi:aminomethyltransferase
MRRTALHAEHVGLGAKMVWFAGWDMPVQYTTIIDEHMAVRRAAGAFDVSHMGKFLIRGRNAGSLMNMLCTNDVQCQPRNRCVYSHLLDDEGRILDDTIVTVLGEDEFLMVPNAATTNKMRKWIEGHIHGQDFMDMSGELSVIAVQGPKAMHVLAGLTSADLRGMKPFWASFVMLDRVESAAAEPAAPLLEHRRALNEGASGPLALVSTTGYTGEEGVEVFCENESAPAVWNAIVTGGAGHGLRPAGLGARDTLRLEKAFLLSGTDFDGTQTSLQTGPPWVIDWKHDFIGKQPMLQQKAAGGYDQLVCMLLKDRGIPRHGYDVLLEGRKVGSVTSGTMSPVLRKGIAMGYVPLGAARVGTQVQIKIRDSTVDAEIVKPPFVKREKP